MSKKSIGILFAVIVLVIVVILIKSQKPVVIEQEIIPENIVAETTVSPTDELDALNTDANIEEAMKLVDEEVNKL